MPRTTKLYSIHPLLACSLCIIFIITIASFGMSGCSDSNLPNYVSGSDSGVASGIIYHGDYHIDAISGYVNFVDVVTGNAEIASIKTISTSTSTYQIFLPQGSYTIDLSGTAWAASSTAYLSGTVEYDKTADNISIFGGIDTLVPVIGATFKE